MAANSDIITADAVDLELEAMRKADCSWQPCEVYFSSTGGGLVVKYEDNSSQDTLTSEKEALTRIRARSLPLQEDDCTRIKPGETVLVNRDSESEGEFFDAEVEKVIRVRHSKRTKCRCTFKIRWLNQDVNEGTLTVPSSSVMKLANKNINNHPTISAFIDAVQLSNSSDSDMSPQMDIVSDFDLDLHDLLERQIEGIRNSVHGSKKRIRDEISVFEDVSKPNGRAPDVGISSDKSRFRRSTRSQKQKSVQKYQASPVNVIPPPVEEQLSDKKSPLNPLAARAAFASLMSHKSSEISIDVKETKSFKSLETEYSTKPDKIVKKLFSTSSSSEMLEEEEEEDDDDDDKMNNTETATRSTHAKVQKVKVNGTIPDNKVSTNKRRTRSTLGKEEETETTREKDTIVSHLQKDKNTLFATSSPERKTISKTKGNKGIDDEVKNSSNGRRRTRSELEVSEEIETESTLGPTEQNSKKRKTHGKAQVSEGKVMSNGGKKGLVELKAQKVRSSPRLNPKS